MLQIVALVYNILQVITWSMVFLSMVPDNFSSILDINQWKTRLYWVEESSFRQFLEIAQGMQAMDIFFCIVGATKNSLASVFPQIISRLFVLWYVLPFVQNQHIGVFMATLCWSWTEVIRYTFYTLKVIDADFVQNSFARIIGFFRYNSFLICYPLGVSGELFCSYQAFLYISTLKEKPATISLPNSWNFSFDF